MERWGEMERRVLGPGAAQPKNPTQQSQPSEDWVGCVGGRSGSVGVDNFRPDGCEQHEKPEGVW